MGALILKKIQLRASKLTDFSAKIWNGLDFRLTFLAFA
jgi:hypothetical protein